MVARDFPLYLFIGQDNLSKDVKIKKIKDDFLVKGAEDFDSDILYGRELTLRSLQEKLLLLPLKAEKRVLLIRNAQSLKDDVKGFILQYVSSKKTKTILILDINYSEPKDNFIREISGFAQVFRFGEKLNPNTFTLNRQIELKRADLALRILSQLLKDGERPERILGGLRYAWERDLIHPYEAKKRLQLLLRCDLDIKRGRLRPEFALEKLIVSLCGLKGLKQP